MGCSSSSHAEPLSAIDVQLAEQAAAEKRHFSILLLGAGESGKSTIIKQLQAVHQPAAFANDLSRKYRTALCQNTLQSMHALLEAMAKLNISLGGGDAAEAAAQAVRNEPEDAKSLRPAIGSAVNLLWEDAGVQKCYAERSKYWLLDAAPYYFKHASRFAEPEYTPTEEDAIMARVRTTGILVSEFQDPPFKYSVVDVGGQRSERRKWIHCFDNASAIIFVVSLRGYHQVMFEDQHTLRMHEALKILEDITSNPLLMPIPLFIFFNKKDLFEKDIKDISLRVGFPEYTGDDGDMLGALKFIQNKFQAIVSKNSPSRAVHMQVVCSAVRMEIKAAFTDVKLAIVKHYKMEATNGSRK